MLTNPPFGGKAKIDDAHVLDQYELPRWDSNDSRALMPAEQLFVEAALKFVKPGGHLIIVLPDGILNNPGLRFIRSWLLRRARLIASIDLPKTTFKASGGGEQSERSDGPEVHSGRGQASRSRNDR